MILSEEPYLILHKVRGEPAFDIACKMDVEEDDEPWWIIPTSGHRAYPIHWCKFDNLIDGCGILMHTVEWDALPDHYEIHAAPGKGKWTGGALLERLGLRKPQPKFARRF